MLGARRLVWPCAVAADTTPIDACGAGEGNHKENSPAVQHDTQAQPNCPIPRSQSLPKKSTEERGQKNPQKKTRQSRRRVAERKQEENDKDETSATRVRAREDIERKPTQAVRQRNPPKSCKSLPRPDAASNKTRPPKSSPWPKSNEITRRKQQDVEKAAGLE